MNTITAVRLNDMAQQLVIVVYVVMGVARRFENALQFPSIEEVDLKQLEHLLEAETYTGFELEPGQDEISDHGYIDLAQHGIFRSADKGFEAEILPDEPEEDLDLPALLVDVGDSFFGERSK